MPGDRIAIDRNPAAVPVLTYRTSSSRGARPGSPARSDNRIIHLNGIAVDILDRNADGGIRVRISWDQQRLQSDVRWCGNIHLHEPMVFEKKVKLRLDQGRTPQKPKDPVEFNGEWIFADTSSLEILPGSSLELGKNARLEVVNGSTLVLRGGSAVEIGPRAKIIIHPGAGILAEDGALVTGRGKILLEKGAREEIRTGSGMQVRVKRD